MGQELARPILRDRENGFLVERDAEVVHFGEEMRDVSGVGARERVDPYGQRLGQHPGDDLGHVNAAGRPERDTGAGGGELVMKDIADPLGELVLGRDRDLVIAEALQDRGGA